VVQIFNDFFKLFKMKFISLFKKITLAVLFVFTFPAIMLISCKKKKTNESLSDEARGSGLTLYKNKDTIHPPLGGSPHGDFKLKFNSKAIVKFDGSGRLPENETFDKGSLLVKEIYSGGVISLYAVMKKDPDSKFSSGGWLWGEYGPDGKTVYGVDKKGEACISCHRGTPNRDLARSFDLH